MSELKDLEVYRLAMRLGEKVWEIVLQWDNLAKYTLGKQLVCSTDSIAHNISEGFGRYFFKENRQFCYYARGSLFEAITQIEKANARKLLSEEEYSFCMTLLNTLGPKLNNYIRSIGQRFQH